MNLFSQLELEPTHEELYPGAVLMRGLALPQDREFFAAIRERREPNASVAQCLTAMQTLDALDQQLKRGA